MTIKKPFFSPKTKKNVIAFLLVQSIFAINNYYHLNKIIESKVNENAEGYQNFTKIGGKPLPSGGGWIAKV